MYPEDLKYTKTHEWVKIEGNVLTIGITDFAVKELMGINHVYINEVVSGTSYKPGLVVYPIEEEDFQDRDIKRGIKFLPGKTVAEIDASKDVVYIYSPAQGIVIQMNDRVNRKVKKGSDKICLIDKDPYWEGWIAKIEISDPSSLIPLMNVEEYQEFLLEEENEWEESGDF